MSATGHRLLILPVFDRVEEVLQREAEEHGIVRADRSLTLSRLVDSFAETAIQRADLGSWWLGFRFASHAELAIVRRSVVRELAGELPDDQRQLITAGSLPRLLARFCSECAEGQVEPRELTSFVAEHEPHTPRLDLLAQLYARYRKGLASTRLLDDNDRLRLALEVCSSRQYPLPPVLDGVTQVVIRDVFDWSAARLALIVALSKRLVSELGPPERVRLVLPYSHEGQRLFHYMESALREIESRDDAPIELEFGAIEGLDSAPAAVAAALFRDGSRVAGDGIRLVAAPGVEQERRQVARTIRRLVDGGTLPDDITIGLRHPDPNWQAMASQLAEYGVPWRYRRGHNLSATPLFRHVMSLLEAVVEDLPKASMVRILTSAYSPRHIALGAGGGPGEESEGRSFRAADDRVAAILDAAGVRDLTTGADGRRSGYQVRLQAYLDRIQPEDVGKTGSLQGDLFAPGPIDRKALYFSRQKAQVDAILQRVSLLQGLARTRSAAQWARAMARLLDHRAFDPRPQLRQLHFQNSHADRPSTLDRAGLLAQGSGQQAWDKLQAVLEDLSGAEGAASLALSPAGFKALLQEIGDGLSLNPAGARGAAVVIAPLRQLAGARFSHLFIPHVNEGQFPAPPRIDPLFKDPERAAFNRWRRGRSRAPMAAFRLEEPQPDGERVPVRRTEDTLLLAVALGACTQRAQVSWITRDTIGRPQLPSLFIEALSDATGAPIEGEPVEVIPGNERIVTREEVSLLAAHHARLGLTTVDRATWSDLAQRIIGPERWLSVTHRARIELARHLFFTQPDGGEVHRAARPDIVPIDYLPHLGYVDHADLQEWVRTDRCRFDAERPTSATRLERYGACPARFFFQDVLGLRPDETADEEMSPLAKGTLLHDVVDNIYDALSDEEVESLGDLSAMAEAAPARLRRLLDQVMDDSITRLQREKHFGHPRLLALGWGQLRDAILDALLEWGSDKILFSAPPLRRELRFGDEPESALPIELPQRKIHVRGAIDRIDHAKGGHFVVTDYKLGKMSSPAYRGKVAAKGLHRTGFQLSLYGLAALRAFGDEVRTMTVQYYGFKDRKAAKLEWGTLQRVLGDALPPERRLILGGGGEETPFLEGLDAVIGGIDSGVFAPATRDCMVCDFAQQCRVTNRVRARGWPQ